VEYRNVTILLRIAYFAAAAISLFAGAAVTASMFITDRASQSSTFWFITVAVSLYFALIGAVLLGVARHLPAINRLAWSLTGDDGARLRHHWRRLAAYMLLGGLLFLPILVLVTYAILARIDEGFAVFG
jgi:hypothetical protein